MPSAIPNPLRARAGQVFRRLREKRDWTQVDVERESIRLFGEQGALRPAQISRIEKGMHDRVSLDDAVRLGRVFGLTPAEVAELYGLYEREKDTVVPREIQMALALLPDLPFDLREGLLFNIETATAVARHHLRERGQVGSRR